MDRRAYIEDPSKLLDLVEWALRELRGQRDDPELCAKERQLREVRRAIEKLETARTTVPDDLRKLKMDLLLATEEKKSIEDRIAALTSGLLVLARGEKLPRNGRKVQKVTTSSPRPIVANAPASTKQKKKAPKAAAKAPLPGQLLLFGEEEASLDE